MADIADLAIKLTANASNFVAGMTLAQRQLKEFKAEVANLQSVALGVSATLAGMWNTVSRGVEDVRRLGNTTGAATENIIGLGLGLRSAGVDAQRLGPLLLSLQRVMADASLGNRFAQQTLGRAGIAGGDTAAGFVQSVRALEGIADPMQRAALAFRLFGENASAALSVVGQGSASLTVAQARADRLGLSFSRFDAEGIRRANESLARMNDLFTGLTRSVIVALAPYVDHIATRLEEWTEQAGGFRNIVQSVISTLVEGLARALDTMHQIRQTFEGINSIGRAFSSPINFAFAAGRFITGITGRDPLSAGGSPGDVLRGLDRPNPFLAGPPNPNASGAAAAAGASAALSPQAALSAFARLFAEGQQLSQRLRTPLDAFREEQVRLQRLFDSRAIDLGTFRRARAAAGQSLLGGESSIPQLAGAATVNSSAAGEAIARFQAGFFDPVDTIARIADQQLNQTTAMNTAVQELLRRIRDGAINLGLNDG